MFTSCNGDTDIQKKHVNNKGSYVITSGLDNNGILGKSDFSAKIFPKNSFTVDMFGNVFYRNFDYKMVTHARVFSLNPKFKITKNIGIFISGSLKYINKLFSYNNMCSWNKIKDYYIKLPKNNSEINFNFMETVVAELEAQKVAKLEAYLKTTGLDDYELTEEERELFSWKPEFKNFKIVDIFNVKNTKSITKSKIIPNSGTVPYLTASEQNNSVNTYIDCNKNMIDKGQCIFIGGKTLVITYQKQDFCSNDSHNLALYCKEKDILSDEEQLYLCGALNKALSHKYSWGNSISKTKIKNDIIRLPITKQGKIDFKYIKKYTKIIQKLIIKSIIEYKDDLIDKTKIIVSND